MISETQPVADESRLDRLVDLICEQIQCGSFVDLDELIRQYPDLADRLRVIYPTVVAIANWSHSGSQRTTDAGLWEGIGNREVGDFRIVRQIGRGGMGVVYEARQLSIDRQVALKVLPLAALVDTRALQRFRNEVTAIATLEHPHIVSVYAVGEERGVHYYAMRLVRGQSLADVIRELRNRASENSSLGGAIIRQVLSEMDRPPTGQSGEPPSPTATVVTGTDAAAAQTRSRRKSQTARSTGDAEYFRNIAQLVIQAAEALQHAHDNGIVHRDVKPGNLLLDQEGTVFVSDFGLARIETGAGVTMSGDLLGTLRYMSPEQVSARREQIDHRTDIYSLGATLYELLTLQPMWSGNDKAELVRKISFEEPVSPRKINPAIPPDLETIVRKATSKEPLDRYASAGALAGDLRSFLEHKPIRARRPSIAQRIGKWTRRNPAIMWSAVLLLTLLTVGSLISTSLVVSANIEAKQQNLRAEENLDRVLQAIDDFLWRVGESGLANVPGTEQLRKNLLNDALAICQSMVRTEGDSPGVQLRSAGARASLATIYRALGDDDAAGHELKIAIADLESWVAKYPDHDKITKARQDLANACNSMGNVYSGLGLPGKSVAMYQRALSINDGLERPDDIVDDPKGRLLRGIFCGNYGAALGDLKRDAEAEVWWQQAVYLLKTLVNRYPHEADYQVRLGWALNGLGGALHNQRKTGKAAENYLRSIAVLREYAGKCSNIPWARSILGGVLLDHAILIGDPSELTEQRLQESRSVFQQLARQFPNVPEYRASLSSAQLNLAGVHRERGNLARSAELLEDTIPIQKSLVDDFPARPDYRADLAKLLADFSGVLRLSKSGPVQKSADALQQAIQQFGILVRDYPDVPDHRQFLCMAIERSANDLCDDGQIKDAEKAWREAVSVAARLVDEFPDNASYRSRLASLYAQRASNLLNLDDYETALNQLQRGLAVMKALTREFPGDLHYQETLVNLQFTLAATKCNLGDLEQGEHYFSENMAFREKLLQSNPANPGYRFNYGMCLGNLAEVYRKTGRPERARNYFEQGLGVFRELDKDHPNDVGVRQRIAQYASQLIRLHTELGDRDQAEAMLKEAVPVVVGYVEENPDHEELLKRLIDLGASAGVLGRRQESISILRKCVDISDANPGSVHRLHLRALNHLGLIHMDLLEWQAARECFTRVIEICRGIPEPDATGSDYPVILAGAICNRGNSLVATGELDAAHEDFTAAIEDLLKVEDPNGMARVFLTNSWQGRAVAHRKSGRLDDSLADLDRALQLVDEGRHQTQLEVERLKTLALLGDYLQAADDTEQILAQPEMEHVAFVAASVFATAAGQAQQDETLEAGERQARSRHYSDRAFELLDIARQEPNLVNVRAVDYLVRDSDWSALRDDRRFASLLDSLADIAK
jgi:serine/threonine protein kinase/tetratricopeptide (TPR) repeat protein